MAEANVVEEILKKLSAHKGVEAILVLTGEGILIRSTLDPALSTQYAGWVHILTYRTSLMYMCLAIMLKVTICISVSRNVRVSKSTRLIIIMVRSRITLNE